MGVTHSFCYKLLLLRSTSLTTLKFIHRHSSIRTSFERVFRKIFWTLLGYTVAKVPALAQEIRLGSPDRFSSWDQGRLLVRRWGLGTRLDL